MEIKTVTTYELPKEMGPKDLHGFLYCLHPSSTRPRQQNFCSSVATMALSLLIVLAVFILVHDSFMKLKGIYKTDEPHNKQQQTKPAVITAGLKQSGKCVLPAHPEHGIYIVTTTPLAKHDETLESLKLTVSCLPDHGVLGSDTVSCRNGVWSDPIPECVRFCKLDGDPSVHYHCLVNSSTRSYRTCNAYEPSGTIVRPECNSPNYYSDNELPFMKCIHGSWDYVAVCSPGSTKVSECGLVSADDVDLRVGSRPAKPGELPWHVGIYRKNRIPYMQICGGSIISNKLVISAAHCFWNDVSKELPASEFAVAAGKIYRPWNNQRDVHAQKSDVKEIKIPVHFQGSTANYQQDIAVLILETAFEYGLFIRPVCLDFDVNLDERQLQPGHLGKVAGWGLSSENRNASQVLKVVGMPYVDIAQCITALPVDFRKYITSDKICAGNLNGTPLWSGESGGGLVFPESDRGTDRYYLRGVVSVAPSNNNFSNSYALTTFTQILNHEHFVKLFLGSGQTEQQNDRRVFYS